MGFAGFRTRGADNALSLFMDPHRNLLGCDGAATLASNLFGRCSG